MLCRGNHIAGRRVDHGDARLGGRFNVDVVNAHAGAANDAQPFARPDHLGRRLGGAAHEQGVVVADDLDQLLRRQIGADIDFKTVRVHERLQAGFRQRVTDQYSIVHSGFPKIPTWLTNDQNDRPRIWQIRRIIADKSEKSV